MLVVIAAISLNWKSFPFLVAALIFLFLAFYGGLPPRADWPRGLASFAWCLAMAAFFLWTAGVN
jgi:hypothetical protein